MQSDLLMSSKDARRNIIGIPWYEEFSDFGKKHRQLVRNALSVRKEVMGADSCAVGVSDSAFREFQLLW